MEADHGKGLADGRGAAIKKKDISNARVLFEELQQQKSTIQLFYIGPEDMEAVDVHVLSQLPTIRGTMKIHQVMVFSGLTSGNSFHQFNAFA